MSMSREGGKSETTYLTLLEEADVVSPDLCRPPLEADVAQSELESRRDDGTSLLCLVEVGGVDGVDATDVVEVETPQVDRGRGAEATGEEVFDASEQVVGEFEIAVADPLLSLEDGQEGQYTMTWR